MEFAKNIAYTAGEIMRKYFKTDNEATYKMDNTIVTKADTEINEYLIKQVKQTYPSHAVYGEEDKFGQSNYVWVCDPVDGTAMYARHIPVAVFSLALVIDGTPVLGVVYDPFTDNLYSAIKGQGAYNNSQKIHVNNLDLHDKESVSHFDMWTNAEYNIFDAIKKLAEKSYFISIGSVTKACMCVANGDFTLAIFPGTINKNFDIAAAKVIVEEAGGMVTDLFGNNQRYDKDINGAIISNGKVHDEVLNVLKKYNK